MIHFRTTFLAAAAVIATAFAGQPAKAQSEVPIRGEILPGWVQADGTRIAAIRLTLAPGWKTYWRAPGDAGIPPSFDWSGSANVTSVGVAFPTPKVFDQGGLRSIGYSDAVVLPLTIQPTSKGAPVALNARIELGVCSDICVPETLRLSGTLDGGSATVSPVIAAAIVDRPQTAAEAGVRAVTCALSPDAKGMRLRATLDMPATGSSEMIVLEPGNPTIWASEMKTWREGGTLIATGELASNSGEVLAIDRSALRLTVLGSDRAVDIRGCTSG